MKEKEGLCVSERKNEKWVERVRKEEKILIFTKMFEFVYNSH